MYILEDVTVVSIEQAISAPFATRQLADLGARVIKIEKEGTGDFARKYDDSVKGLSSHFVWSNRSKESIELDIKVPFGKDVLDKLLSNADVFINNLAPGAMDRLGYTDDYLEKKYPELIICNITGYGEGGPYSDKKAYDLLIQCEAGLMSITGTKEVPSKTGISIADIATGMYAYTGILSALLLRNKTGKGTIIEVSMLEALGEWMGYPLYYTNYSKKEPERTGGSHATIYPYGSFACKGDKSVFFGIQNEVEWKMFCEVVLKEPELYRNESFNNNTKRNTNREKLKSIIEDKFTILDIDTVITRLDDARIANAQLNSVQDFIDHPQLSARNRWREIDSSVGRLKALVPPASIKSSKVKMEAVPELGEHTNSILEELGFSKK